MPAGAVSPKDENPANQTICAPFGRFAVLCRIMPAHRHFPAQCRIMPAVTAPPEAEWGEPGGVGAILTSVQGELASCQRVGH